MTKDEFLSYCAAGYKQIPVYEEFVADLVSPLYLFASFYQQENACLFESAKSFETKGRYSIMTLPSERKYNFGKDELEIFSAGKRETVKGVAAYDYIDELTREFKSPRIKGLPDFLGGLVGYFSYESFNFIEPHLKMGAPDIPYISLCRADEVLIFDNFKGTFFIVVNTTEQTESGYEAAKARIGEIKSAIFSLQPSAQHDLKRSDGAAEFVSNVAKADFCRQVEFLQSKISEGEIMQAVLSKEVTFKGEYDPFTLYRALRLLNPSPYMFYLNFGGFNVIGASPEILVRKMDDEVTIRPIAGTRRRGETDAEDQQNKSDLLADAKEKAEHMMLVDLARNDVSKVADAGTVSVDELMVVEKYSHVMHMTSNVVGRPKSSVSQIDCLKAALPAGTLSGAPKIRAMELLAEIESRARGVYGGAVGYIGYNGSLDTAIAIRTAVHFPGAVKVGVGGGVVFDSVPASEWNETEAKLEVFREALRYK